MGSPSSLWQKVALRDAGPRELDGEGDALPVDLVVGSELIATLTRNPSGPRALLVDREGEAWSFPPAAVLASDRALLGTRVVSDDPHIIQLGAMGMVGLAATPVVLYEAWSRGVLPVGVPRTIRVQVNGPIPEYIGPVDLALELVAQVGFDGYAGTVLEFQGDAMEGLPPSLCAQLLGAASLTHCLTALTPLTEATLAGLRRSGFKSQLSLAGFDAFRPDDEAPYRELAIINADQVPPRVAEMRRGDVRPAEQLAGKLVERCVVGGCLGGDLGSLGHLATLLEDARAAAGVDLIVIPADARTRRQADDLGLTRRIERSGGRVLAPSQVPAAKGMGLTLTTNPCLEPDALVAGLPTVLASASIGRATTWRGYA